MNEANQFSQRQKEVIELLLQGKGNKQIALALGISEHTVEFHLGRIYTKLGVTSRAEAILQLGKTAENPLSENLRQSPVDESEESVYPEKQEQFKKRWMRNPFLFYGALLLTLPIIAFIYYWLHSSVWSYEREAEFPDEYTVGQTMDRSNASGTKVHGQFGTVAAWPAQPGSITYRYINIPKTDHLYLKFRYSKYSSSSVPILVFLDDESTPRASVFPKDQGDWNRFAWTESIDLGTVKDGAHSLKFFTEGQVYGVADLDRFILTTEPP